MSKNYLPYVSFSIWSQFFPAIGQEHLHCDMRRGFLRARKKEPKVSALLEEESAPLRIGHWVQKGIFELHQMKLLNDFVGVDKITQNLVFQKNSITLKFNQETAEVKQRVKDILKKYQANPILQKYKIIELSPGDEGIPPAITLCQDRYRFNLFAPFDCLLEENGTLHILDLKIGISNFDLRQAYVYLLAASVLYPNRSCMASFYNVEKEEASEILTATPQQLIAFRIELAEIAKRHQKELQQYRSNPAQFSIIYPPNPGGSCRNCQFNTLCQFYIK